MVCRKKIIQLLLFVLAWTGLQAQVTDPRIRDLVRNVNLDTLSSYVRILSGEDSVMLNSQKYLIQSRKPGQSGHYIAGDYIRMKLSSYGLESVEQPFTTTVSGTNIYAVQPGEDTSGIYIVCAHYDAVKGYAADDNATGTAAVLEAARLLSRCLLDYTVIYGFWDQEETGLNGSKYFAGQAKANQTDIRGVINLDMLGWDGNSDGKAEIHTRNYSTSVEMASLLQSLNTEYTIGLDISVINPGSTSSDHSSFWTYNYPAILLIEASKGGDFNPYYHTTNDRYTALNLPYYHRMAKLAVAGISHYVLSDDSEQLITLNTGWNIFSANVLPDSMDMKFLVQPLIKEGSIFKIQDESGNVLENSGIMGGWTNHIGNISMTEGYKVKVARDCVFELKGRPSSLPFKIPLKVGWNISGFPHNSEMDGAEVIQQLIDRGTLLKVQDEKGNAVEDWGVFGGWRNNIGNFKPGEGYKIKVSRADTLTINAFYPKSGFVSPAETWASVHFLPVFEGNGLDHMNINLVNIPDGLLDPGDEIAVFDESNCVGAATIRNPQSAIRNLSIAVSASDDLGSSGFTEGHPITLKLWKASENKEYLLEPEILIGVFTFIKNESALVSLGKYEVAGLIDNSLSGNGEVKAYPNPTSGKIHFMRNKPESDGLHVRVINSAGQQIMTKLILTNPGIIDLSGNSPGIYYVKMICDSLIQTEKILLR